MIRQEIIGSGSEKERSIRRNGKAFERNEKRGLTPPFFYAKVVQSVYG